MIFQVLDRQLDIHSFKLDLKTSQVELWRYDQPYVIKMVENLVLLEEANTDLKISWREATMT